MTENTKKDRTKAARKIVQEHVDQYKTMVLQTPLARQPVVTEQYVLKQPEGIETITGTAVKERQRVIRQMIEAVNQLNELERTIVIRKYLSREEPLDYQLYNELLLSERTYYRAKRKALDKLAMILGAV